MHLIFQKFWLINPWNFGITVIWKSFVEKTETIFEISIHTNHIDAAESFNLSDTFYFGEGYQVKIFWNIKSINAEKFGRDENILVSLWT